MASPEGWHPADIIAAVRKSGSTMMEVAIAAGFHPSALSHCLRFPVPDANKAIAAHLDKHVHELWPQWFDENGDVLPNRRKATRARAAASRQKRSAA